MAKSDTSYIPAGRPGIPNPVDIHVGKRVRARRTLMGLSQEKLGEAIGLTFQQIQKYERGTNRMGSSRLFDIAAVLGVTVQYFFDDMCPEVAEQSPRLRAGTSDLPAVEFENDPLASRETLELVRAYYRIQDPAVRKGVFELAKAMAKDLTKEGVTA
ncbi:transcriptional regulator [Candidatus Kaiserbacteria bacterium]|nr:MAG: transcriptional regulator [Candidatus Kaiserbacteria bacterium]